MAGDVDEGVLQQHAEQLYAGAPEDFVAARNDAVKALRSSGDRPTATAVAALRRPTQAAWVVNRLVRERSELVEELLELGASLRAAQSSLDADSLRELTRQRRRLVAGVAKEAGALAREAGAPLAPATERQVEDTLQAAVVDADLAEVLRSGLLVQPLSSTGVESLADVQAIPGAPRLTVVRGAKPDRGESAVKAPPTSQSVVKAPPEPEGDREDGAARQRAQRAAQEAERQAEQEAERERARERARLQRDRRAQRRDLEKAESSVARLQRDVDDLRQRLEAAESTLRQAQDRRDGLRSEVEALDALLGRVSGSGSAG
jgi:DNA repair exonuclease SbcCD ATPase subunit